MVAIALYCSKAVGHRLAAQIKLRAELDDGEGLEGEDEGEAVGETKQPSPQPPLPLPETIANENAQVPTEARTHMDPLPAAGEPSSKAKDVGASLPATGEVPKARPNRSDLEKQLRVAELKLEAKRLLPGSISGSSYDHGCDSQVLSFL